MSAHGLVLRALDPSVPAELDLVAERMRLTLVEVLGEERARAVHTPQEIRERLLWHVRRPEGRQAEAFLAVDGEGPVAGHALVRVEASEEGTGRPVGLFATLYVAPGWRRQGVASALLRQGERWMEDRGQREAVTYTDADNHGLQALFQRHGYGRTSLGERWVRLARRLDDKA